MAASSAAAGSRGRGPARGHEPINSNKFTDDSTHEWFVWRSDCPKTTDVLTAHFRVFLKSMPAQSQVDGKRVVFSDGAVYFPWKRPATVRAAHMWVYRTVKDVIVKGGEGTWTVDAASSPPVAEEQPPVVATSLPTVPAVTWPPASSGSERGDAFPTSPALKLLRGGDQTQQTETRYQLRQELGSGAYGKVFAATVGSRQVAVKRFAADDPRQAKIDAAEVPSLPLFSSLQVVCVTAGCLGWPPGVNPGVIAHPSPHPFPPPNRPSGF